MFQVPASVSQQPAYAPKPGPSVVLAQRLDLLKHSDPLQLARDKADYAETIVDLANANQSRSKYAANIGFERLGGYVSVSDPASLGQANLAYGALQFFRYRKYVAATRADGETGAARAAYGALGERNFEETEQIVQAASRYPDIKSKMAVVTAFASRTIAYDYEKRDFETEISRNVVNDRPAGTDDGGQLFNLFASGERTERSRLGMCFDAALEQMDLLIRGGVPAEKVGVVVLNWQSATNETLRMYHVVTLVDAQDGVHVLDSDGTPPQRADDYFSVERGVRAVPVISFGEGGVNLYQVARPSVQPQPIDNVRGQLQRPGRSGIPKGPAR